MSRVFLSHCSVNNAQALAVAQWLEQNGWSDYFLDIAEDHGLHPGVRWQQELKKASHRCEAVVVLVSRAWRKSPWCLGEYLLAQNLGKKIFPVLIDDISIDELPHEMRSEWQVCDIVRGDDRVMFDVERKPFVPARRVDLAKAGLAALKRGLQSAGLEATAFPWPPEDEPDRAPYRGLKPYETQDAAVFFGRDAAIVRGLDRVRQLRDKSVDRLLVILGSSGAGKSSFLRAGLWPRLKRDDHHFYPLPVVRPRAAAINGDDGLVNSLAEALTDAGARGVSRGEIRGRFAADHDGDALMGYLKQLRDALLARAVTEVPEPTLILPIDQGEELYAPDGAAEAEQLRTQLSRLAGQHDDQARQPASLNVLAIVTIRTDLFEHMQTDSRLHDVGRQIIDLTPMDRAEYKLIIEGPGQRATDAGKALKIEPALTEQLLKDTRGADALPMLAFTLERLYDDYGSDGDLTLVEYKHLGGVQGCLTAAIDTAMASPRNAPVIPADNPTQQRLLRKAFIPWLAEVDEQSGERRRRVADWDDLPVDAHPMLERLTDARLLVRAVRTDADTRKQHAVVEIAHEALLRQWPAMVGWLDADHDSLKAIGSVLRAAQHWTQNDRSDEYLDHTGERLLDAEKLLEREDFKKRLQGTGCAYLARCRAYELEQAELSRSIRRLSDYRTLEDLEARADKLWPALEKRETVYDAWLTEADQLAAQLPDHEATLAKLKQRARPDGEFAEKDDAWWYETLSRLVGKIKALSDAKQGLVGKVRKRLEFAKTIKGRSISDADVAAKWANAADAIRAQYGGLKLEPQLGMVPIGPDPHSHLWEFAHLQTGEVPERVGGQLVLTDNTGLVFVLLPGERFWMGAQKTNPDGKNFDPHAYDEDSPHEIELAPFFLSKYEMTQGQWLLVTGHNPSRHHPGTPARGEIYTLRNPVEQVTWHDCDRVLRRIGMTLPTEAQWEYGARATKDSPWWTGTEKASLSDAANLADQSYREWGALADTPVEPWHDGYARHAPVGSFRANDFGLHDVHGNVWEWCADGHGNYELPVQPGDGLRIGGDKERRIFRGGSFYRGALSARSALRRNDDPRHQIDYLGVRPARPIDGTPPP